MLIVDDHPLVFSGLRNAAMNANRSLEFSLARTIPEAKKRLRKPPPPDLTLFDIHLGDGSGLGLVEELRAEGREFQFAILTGSRDWNHLKKATQLGARGFLLKDSESEQIIADVERMLQGEDLFPGPAQSEQRVTANLAQAFHTLTDREKDVLRCIKAGLLNREVADRLGISVRTVETHRAHACEKLGAQNSVQLSTLLLQLKSLLDA
ncbi:MAG: response regulator transcription factor [Spirochaetia bacterium]|nr:response regulator transcription factor [Spirochaetia bacterium]